jgi:hypothetical protein
MMKRIISLLVFFAVLLIGCTQNGSDAESAKELDSLKAGFVNPPHAARPYVWWHWMNGNITKDGIKKDLEWMDRIGIVGFHHFDASLSTPQIVEKRLIYMDEGWKDAFAYAVKVADSLGMEMTVASSPGWSSTGGPWVEPKDAMKKVVWRYVYADGGKEVSLKLPEPYKMNGVFQNQVRSESSDREPYYEDIEVLAVKQPEGRREISEYSPKVTSSSGRFTLDQLTNGDVTDASALKGSDPWIQYEFPEDVTIRTVTTVSSANGRLESSSDGKTFSKVSDLDQGDVIEKTLVVPETTARYFRFVVSGRKPDEETHVAEFNIFPYTKVTRFEDKAAFSTAGYLNRYPTTASASESFPSTDDVISLNEYVDADGNLKWNAPEGRWKIYRFGYSLTGKMNHPAPPEATGYEVDKLDQKAWTRFFHKYIDLYKDASKGLLGSKGIQYILTDSYEAGLENWTPAMFDEFSSRRGYDMHKWLPVIAGEVIDSPEKSDAFLNDFRLTIGDLVTASYDLLTEITQKDYGMKGRYSESHEYGRAIVADGMDMKKTAQIPMSAMWTFGDEEPVAHQPDDKESASVAHIYGQNIAAAESLTAYGVNTAYSYCPENLKKVADLELANGINRFVIHESAHQPDDVHVPGMSLGVFGQWFNRHETWAEMAGTWMDYIARSCYMLQAGRNVAEILYYYGENSNVTMEFMGTLPEVPSGFQWDYCNPDALMNKISFKNGNLVSDSGAEYKMLWMDKNMEYMSLPVLRKIAKLADEGAAICGKRPLHPLGLSDDSTEFNSLVKQIWDSGKANVHEVSTIAEGVAAAGLEPCIELPSECKFLHRYDKGVEIFWIKRRANDYSDTTVAFAIAGKKPQIWHPDTGLMEDASYKVVDGKTIVNVHFVPDDALFVVFAGKGADEYSVPQKSKAELAAVAGPWNVAFQEKRGAPESAVFDDLKSFTESEDPGIKYFSGVATYTNKFNVPDTAGCITLDLGSVKNIAEVTVNGVNCGRAWKEPFIVDITSAVKPGENQLEVKVADLWVNRIIGDLQPSTKEKVAWVDYQGWYKPDSPLQPAGLLGPVKVIQTK